MESLDPYPLALCLSLQGGFAALSDVCEILWNSTWNPSREISKPGDSVLAHSFFLVARIPWIILYSALFCVDRIDQLSDSGDQWGIYFVGCGPPTLSYFSWIGLWKRRVNTLCRHIQAHNVSHGVFAWNGFHCLSINEKIL